MSETYIEKVRSNKQTDIQRVKLIENTFCSGWNVIHQIPFHVHSAETVDVASKLSSAV